jgi:hypothetical protein
MQERGAVRRSLPAFRYTGFEILVTGFFMEFCKNSIKSEDQSFLPKY